MKKYKNKYKVSLKKSEKKKLIELTKKGEHSSRTIYRARTLLMADEGKSDSKISEALKVTITTPYEIRKRYHEGGLKRALYDNPRPGQPKATTDKEEATITAIACTEPDDGYGKWTLDLLTKKVNSKLNRERPLSRGTINNILLKSDLKPWREKNVVHNGNDR